MSSERYARLFHFSTPYDIRALRFCPAAIRADVCNLCPPEVALDSVVRWQLVVQVGSGLLVGVIRTFREGPHLAYQLVNHVLLARDDQVKFVDKVFSETGFDFQIREALFNVCGHF